LAFAEEWVTVPDPRILDFGNPISAAVTSVDAKSIEVLDSGKRRAKVKLDFSSYLQNAKESSPRSLKAWILVELYDCKDRSMQIETTEAHLADGTVKYANAINTNAWLHSEHDPVGDFVCSWTLPPASNPQ
jgi:hypothetical protein